MPAIKDVLIERRRAYRLTIRGRNYIACQLKIGEIDYKPVVYLDGAESLIRRVAEIANQSAPPKK